MQFGYVKYRHNRPFGLVQNLCRMFRNEMMGGDLPYDLKFCEAGHDFLGPDAGKENLDPE